MGAPSDRYHDRVAGIYDSIYDGDAYWRFHRDITWKNLRRYLPREAGAPVLDAGGGTGFWAVRLARSGFSVTLADTSHGMLEAARRKAAREHLADRIEVVHSDIADLNELPSGHFAFALAQGDPLGFCSDPQAGVRALHRVLRPGAVCIASVDNKLAALDHVLASGDLPALERFLADGRTEWLARHKQERFPVTTFTPRDLRRLFSRAGFEVLSLIGKTVLPARRLRERLEDRRFYARLLRLERRLHGEEALLGGAAHLEIAARRPPEETAESSPEG